MKKLPVGIEGTAANVRVVTEKASAEMGQRIRDEGHRLEGDAKQSLRQLEAPTREGE